MHLSMCLSQVGHQSLRHAFVDVPAGTLASGLVSGLVEFMFHSMPSALGIVKRARQSLCGCR